MPRSTSYSKSTTMPVLQKPYSSVANTSHVQVEQPTLGQSLKQGFGFGAGSAIAHRIFGASPTVIVPSDKKIESACEKERGMFETCMKTKSVDDFCGDEQVSYVQCIRLSGNTKHQ